MEAEMTFAFEETGDELHTPNHHPQQGKVSQDP